MKRNTVKIAYVTPTDTPTYSLAELAELGDVTIRTIRYYIGQGLLPSPIAEGPNTRYTAGHVDRLLLIRELQREHLPLAEIRSRLERLDDAQVRDLIEVGHSITEPRGTAFDYIQSGPGGYGSEGVLAAAGAAAMDRVRAGEALAHLAIPGLAAPPVPRQPASEIRQSTGPRARPGSQAPPANRRPPPTQ